MIALVRRQYATECQMAERRLGRALTDREERALYGLLCGEDECVGSLVVDDFDLDALGCIHGERKDND